MQSCPIPASVCEEARRICRNFIWDSYPDQRKCHLISWKKICLPKEEGGLGFRSLRVLDKAYMMKLALHLMANPEKLWVQVMKAKYNCGSYAMPSVSARSSRSSIWRAIVDIWPDVSVNTTWILNNGNGTWFWKDRWLPGMDSLESCCLGHVPSEQADFPVSFYVVGIGMQLSLVFLICL